MFCLLFYFCYCIKKLVVSYYVAFEKVKIHSEREIKFSRQKITRYTHHIKIMKFPQKNTQQLFHLCVFLFFSLVAICFRLSDISIYNFIVHCFNLDDSKLFLYKLNLTLHIHARSCIVPKKMDGSFIQSFESFTRVNWMNIKWE